MINFNTKFKMANFFSSFLPSKLNNSILLYHSITNEFENNIFSVKKENFESQLKILKNLKKQNLMKISDNLKNESSITLSFDDGLANNYLNAYQLINEYIIPSIFFISTDNIGKKGYLTKEMIKEMDRDSIIDFGLHGHNHLSFKNLTYHEIKNEMTTSTDILQNLLGRKINNFSYPYGSLNKVTKLHIKSFSFNCFDSTSSTFNIKNYDKLQIPRISIWNIDNQKSFMNKINGKWDLLNKLQKNNAN